MFGSIRKFAVAVTLGACGFLAAPAQAQFDNEWFAQQEAAQKEFDERFDRMMAEMEKQLQADMEALNRAMQESQRRYGGSMDWQAMFRNQPATGGNGMAATPPAYPHRVGAPGGNGPTTRPAAPQQPIPEIAPAQPAMYPEGWSAAPATWPAAPSFEWPDAAMMQWNAPLTENLAEDTNGGFTNGLDADTPEER